MAGMAAQIVVRISKDGGDFSESTNSPTQFAPGYYKIVLTADELNVVDFALIDITCPGAQKIVKQWTPETDSVDVTSVAEAVWTAPLRTLTFGEVPPVEQPLYCNAYDLYAHWTQAKIESWVGSSDDAIAVAINWASRKIDSDLQNATQTPFNPVPKDISTICVLASGVRLASLAGDMADYGVQAAIAYYKEFVENFNYIVDNQP